MKKQIAVTAYTIPMGLKCVNRREVPGYLLENGLVLMDSERDKDGNYKAGAGMDGMYLNTGRIFEPAFDDAGKIIAFSEC